VRRVIHDFNQRAMASLDPKYRTGVPTESPASNAERRSRWPAPVPITRRSRSRAGRCPDWPTIYAPRTCCRSVRRISAAYLPTPACPSSAPGPERPVPIPTMRRRPRRAGTHQRPAGRRRRSVECHYFRSPSSWSTTPTTSTGTPSPRRSPATSNTATGHTATNASVNSPATGSPPDAITRQTFRERPLATDETVAARHGEHIYAAQRVEQVRPAPLPVLTGHSVDERGGHGMAPPVRVKFGRSLRGGIGLTGELADPPWPRPATRPSR
jgi:hypothetical protein